MSGQVLLLTTAAFALSACGGGRAQPHAATGRYCAVQPLQTSGVVRLSITAMDTKFDTACLVAPADAAFEIRFDNEDSNTHNLDILDHGQSLFDGPVTIGPKVTTYEVPILPAGIYEFRCDVHPTQMHGTFVVGG